MLLRIAPHLVWPLPFVFPVHGGDRLRRWQLAAGMWLYDLLSLVPQCEPPQMLGKRALLDAGAVLRAAACAAAPASTTRSATTPASSWPRPARRMNTAPRS